MKGNEFFKMLGEKFGFDADQLTKISGNDSLKTLDVGDEVANLFKNQTVFTEESAKANPTIRAAIRAEAYNGVDAHVKSLFSKFELSDEDQAEILAGDKTSAKIEKALEKVQLLERKKATASGKGKDSLEKEIDKLNKDIVTMKEGYEAKLKQVAADRESDRINYELKGIYGGLEYPTPSEVPKEVNIATAQNLVEAKLREKGIKIKMTDTGLAPFSTDDTPHYEDNKKISAPDLIKKLLLESKFLKVSEPGKSNNGNQYFQQQQQQQQPQVKIDRSGLHDQLKASLERDGMG